MNVKIYEKPGEDGSIIFICDFQDQDEVSITVSNLKLIRWSLTDSKENIINGRNNVNIPVTKNPQEIVLRGDDLVISSTTKDNKRRLAIYYEYDTSIEGTAYTNLEGSVQYDFEIADKVNTS